MFFYYQKMFNFVKNKNKYMKNLILFIGISGSGKGYYLKNKILNDIPELSKKIIDSNITLNDIIVCPDNIRKELTGDINNHTKEPYIWMNLVPERLKERMNKYDYAILDATNVDRKSRKKFLQKYPGVNKIAIVFEADIELSYKRIVNDLINDVDRSNVPKFVLDKQYLKYKDSLLSPEWDGSLTKPIKAKIVEKLKNEFNQVIFVEHEK